MINLMHSSFIQGMDYPGKLHAQALVNRGISYAALYFWYNIKAGHYKKFPAQILENDLQHFGNKYPLFKEDFLQANQFLTNKTNKL